MGKNNNIYDKCGVACATIMTIGFALILIFLSQNTVQKSEQVVQTQTLPKRYIQPTELLATDIANWGEIPGAFG
jgi:hypothetical protein